MGSGSSGIQNPGVYQVGTPSGYWPESAFNNEKIVQVVCGSQRSAILTETGRVFTWGENNFDHLGLEKVGETRCVSSPTHVTTLSSSHIVQVACGREHTLFLSKQGELFACGWNVSGCKGFQDETREHIPSRVPDLTHITRVAAGESYSVALDQQGDVWVAGLNCVGQLGLKHNVHSQPKFVRVPNLPGPMTDVACGSKHTVLLARSKVILIAGGMDKDVYNMCMESDLWCFKALVLSSPVIGISNGYSHIAVLTEDGAVWSWGSNDCGQLGNDDKKDVNRPYKVRDNVSQINVGYKKTALFTDEGGLLVCGRGTHGELGSANSDVLVPTIWPMSPGLVISQITFADQFSLLIVESVPECKPSPRLYSDITDNEKSLMRILECPVCLKIMSAPIYICGNGHSLCGACGDNVSVRACPVCRGPFSQSRNRTLEDISASLELPCPDCRERISVPRLEGHAECCPEKQCPCPVEKSCGWSGRLETILQHCSAAHPEQTWTELPHFYVHRDFQGGVKKYVVFAFGNIFEVNFKFNVDTHVVLVAMQLVEPQKSTDHFLFEVDFTTNRNAFSIRFRKSVSSCRDSLVYDDYIVLDGTNLNRLLTDYTLTCLVSVVKRRSS